MARSLRQLRRQAGYSRSQLIDIVTEIESKQVSDRSRDLLQIIARMVPAMQSRAPLMDRESQFPTSEIAPLTSCGALSAVLPVSHGGLGMGTEARGAGHLCDLLRIIGNGNLAVGRVFEGHVNALVLVAKYGTDEQLGRVAADVMAGHLFAVWNTQPPAGLQIIRGELRGSKIFCSAAGHATRAIVTARDEEKGSRMLLLTLRRGERVETLPFRTQGMRAATTQKVVFDGVSISDTDVIGQPDDYIREPAFSAGAWRTCAVTVGGLEALIEETRKHLLRSDRHRDPHQQARMGRAIIAEETARLWVTRAATIAEESEESSEYKAAYVNLARTAIEAATIDAMNFVQRSLGLAALLEPNPVERLIRDLSTYLRQPAPDEALTEAAACFMQREGYGIDRDMS
jgi:alkylation response protein AidB-like acyl-CoA dehydrogenase